MSCEYCCVCKESDIAYPDCCEHASKYAQLAAAQAENKKLAYENASLRGQNKLLTDAHPVAASYLIVRADQIKAHADLSWSSSLLNLDEARSQLAAAQADLAEMTRLRDFYFDGMEEAHSHLASAQAEIVELRRVLAMWLVHQNDRCGADNSPLSDTKSALSTPTVAQPLLDALKKAYDWIDRNDLDEQLLTALAPWVKTSV